MNGVTKRGQSKEICTIALEHSTCNKLTKSAACISRIFEQNDEVVKALTSEFFAHGNPMLQLNTDDMVPLGRKSHCYFSPKCLDIFIECSEVGNSLKYALSVKLSNTCTCIYYNSMESQCHYVN